MKNFFCAVFVILLTFSSSIIWGGVIELDNGSRIIGKIERIDGGKVHIKTDFAGTLAIDLARVANLVSDDPLFVAFKEGNRLYGKIDYSKEQTQVEMPDGNTVVTKDDLVALWLKGQLDPLATKLREWSFDEGVDVGGKTGNSEKFNTGGKINAALRGPIDRLLFYLRWVYSREEGEKSDDEIIGGIDYEADFAERHSWYARIELENDDMKDLDLRTTAAVGYGHYFLKEQNHILRGRTGIMYRHESYSSQDSESTVGPDLGLYHMYKFGELWSFMTDITYTPSFEDFHDYRIWHESAFEVPLANSDAWKLQLGITNDYDSQPAEGKERLDTTYYSRLVFAWE